MSDQPPIADAVDTEGGKIAPGAISRDRLITVELSDAHKTEQFVCSKSPRVAGFFAKEAKFLIPRFCRAFVALDPNNEGRIWGYYTLSSNSIRKENLSGSDERRVAKNALGYAPPMALIGFMGKDDTAPPDFGGVLLIDAARRASRQDIANWGIILEPERGKENQKLWAWYARQGFKECRKIEGMMYAPLSAFMPELQGF